jgi:thiamine transporter ThiT
MTFSFWNGVAQGAVVGLLWGIIANAREFIRCFLALRRGRR